MADDSRADDISVTGDKPVESDETVSRNLGAVRLLVVDDDVSVGKQSAAQELGLSPVAKVDTQAVIRIVDSLGGATT